MNALIRFQFLFLWCLALGPSAAMADGLYTGVVPVENQSEPARQEALPDALRQVLRKLSGEQVLPPGRALDDALAGAASLVIAFGYQEGAQTAPDGTEAGMLKLEARFSQPAVDGIVRELGLRRWRVERAPVVLWVVIDDGSQRALMPLEYQRDYDLMAAVAEARGLPVAWPGLSPELLEQVDVQLLWGGYTEQLIGSGSDSEGVAVVTARREGPEWNVRWTYADASTSNSWRTRSTDLAMALEEGVNLLVDQVASINAIGPAGQGVFSTELLMTGLSGGADYARTLAYLEALSLVDGIDVLAVGPAGVRLRLALNAEPDYLEDILRRDGVLESADGPNGYRLTP